jgi:hypothetical protein
MLIYVNTLEKNAAPIGGAQQERRPLLLEMLSKDQKQEDWKSIPDPGISR